MESNKHKFIVIWQTVRQHNSKISVETHWTYEQTDRTAIDVHNLYIKRHGSCTNVIDVSNPNHPFSAWPMQEQKDYRRS